MTIPSIREIQSDVDSEVHGDANLARDIELGSSPQRRIRVVLRRLRGWVEKHPVIRFVYRFLVGVLGAGVIVLGLLLVPLPGPGWLVVFIGLGILGTEFPFAHRITSAVKRVLLRFWSWMQRRRAARQARNERQQGNVA